MEQGDSPGHLKIPLFVLRLVLATSVATLVTFIFATLAGACCSSYSPET